MHEVRVTGLYAKVICLTPGCKFEVWFKPTDRSQSVTNDSKFKFDRCTLQSHTSNAHLKELKAIQTP